MQFPWEFVDGLIRYLKILNIRRGGNGNEKNEEQKALEILRLQPEITAKEMASQMGVSARTIGRIMKRLRDKEIITRVGSDRKGYWEIQDKC